MWYWAMRPGGERLGDGTSAATSGSGQLQPIQASPKQLEILLVLGHLGAVNPYPFPRTCHTAGLKRYDVVP
jgi:hypothetical protein